MNWLVNLGIYQTAWFVCVLGGDRFAWVGFLLLGLHFFLSPYRLADVIMVLVFLLIGLILDGSLAYLGVFSFESPVFPIPLWLMCIWTVFATLPNHSLAWLKNKHLLNALFGAVGGPLAYWAGVRLGAAQFNEPLLYSLLILACVWALFWPVAMLISTWSRNWAQTLARTSAAKTRS